MSESDQEQTDETVTVEATVKFPKGHGSRRITPKKAVRDAVDMQPGEPWAWFWHPESERFFLRRAGAHLDGIPDESFSVGIAEARQNGDYLDFAIPTDAVDAAGVEKGQTWTFTAIDHNTMTMARK